MRLISIVSIMVISAASAIAEPTSGNLYVSYLRTYADGTVFVTVNTSSFCSTNTFTVLPSAPAKNQFLATLLTAQSLEKPVLLEVSNATGCNGWGTAIQSIFLAN